MGLFLHEVFARIQKTKEIHVAHLARPSSDGTGTSEPPVSPGGRVAAERDRFVALAFCWADILLELDTETLQWTIEEISDGLPD